MTDIINTDDIADGENQYQLDLFALVDAPGMLDRSHTQVQTWR